MIGSRRGVGLTLAALTIGILALFFGQLAQAQENLDQGKTAADLYASDCAICHKSPRGLSKVGGIFGLQSFLRQHYTASRESAARLAAYLQTIDRGPVPAERRRKAPPPKASPEPRHERPDRATPDDKKPKKKATETGASVARSITQTSAAKFAQARPE